MPHKVNTKILNIAEFDAYDLLPTVHIQPIAFSTALERNVKTYTPVSKGFRLMLIERKVMFIPLNDKIGMFRFVVGNYHPLLVYYRMYEAAGENTIKVPMLDPFTLSDIDLLPDCEFIMKTWEYINPRPTRAEGGLTDTFVIPFKEDYIEIDRFLVCFIKTLKIL